jgi:hypothetical protein
MTSENDAKALIELWRETRQSYRRGPIIIAHVMDLGSKLADALEALSSSAPAEADLAELPDGPCLGPSACNESFGRLLNLLHERGYCETCEGTGTMQAVCGFDPVKGEITTPEVCGECHGVAGKALKIRDFEELRVDVGSRVAVVYGAFSDLNDLCHRFSIAAPSQTPEERPAGETPE